MTNEGHPNDSTNIHLLGKIEISMILQYLENNNIELGEDKIGVQANVIEMYSPIDEEKYKEKAMDISLNKQESGVRLASLNN